MFSRIADDVYIIKYLVSKKKRFEKYYFLWQHGTWWTTPISLLIKKKLCMNDWKELFYLTEKQAQGVCVNNIRRLGGSEEEIKELIKQYRNVYCVNGGVD